MEIVGFGDVCDDDFHPESQNTLLEDDVIAVWPVDDNGVERKWRYARQTIETIKSNLKVEISKKGTIQVLIVKKTQQFKTIWYSSLYNAGDYGTKQLTNMGISNEKFKFPKSVHLVKDCIYSVSNHYDLILDYFAGSGTTAHAVISLNREDQGNRKYNLVEQGEYFNTVIKPRIQKVVFSADWKDGKPISEQTGISHAFKYMKIESYEDTLNNLELVRDNENNIFLHASDPKVYEDYLLKYMLEIESKKSLLSVDDFKHPFQYQLKIAVDSAGAYENQPIDLVETFNYLIGLKVNSIDSNMEKGWVLVEGELPTGEQTLIIWRDCDLLGYESFVEFCERRKINPKDSEYDVIYVNGDHNLPTMATGLESEGGITKSLKLRQIEPEFLERMFEGGV